MACRSQKVFLQRSFFTIFRKSCFQKKYFLFLSLILWRSTHLRFLDFFSFWGMWLEMFFLSLPHYLMIKKLPHILVNGNMSHPFLLKKYDYWQSMLGSFFFLCICSTFYIPHHPICNDDFYFPFYCTWHTS